MSIEKKKIGVRSSDGVHTLSGVVYLPDKEIKGIYHIVHGMTEHIGRYDKIMTDLANEGFISVGYDNLGHGYTVNDKGELGYIAKKKGWELLARDVGIFAAEIKKEYGKDLPYFLMGHSMGSFIVRLSAERFFSPDKLIIMGTGGPNPAAGAGLAVIGVIKTFKGDKHISKLVDDLAFGSYNKKFQGEGEDSNSWLTTDLTVREKYCADEFCNFKFTVSAMGDLIRLMKYSNRAAWFKNMPADLPILIVSGEDDPVCNYGKGILYVSEKLKSAGKDARHILYKNARHEILNDFTYDAVKSDILDFTAHR